MCFYKHTRMVTQTSAPIAVNLTLTAFMYLYSSESNVRGKIEVEEALQGSRSETRDLPEGTKGNNMLYNEGS